MLHRPCHGDARRPAIPQHAPSVSGQARQEFGHDRLIGDAVHACSEQAGQHIGELEHLLRIVVLDQQRHRAEALLEQFRGRDDLARGHRKEGGVDRVGLGIPAATAEHLDR